MTLIQNPEPFQILIGVRGMLRTCAQQIRTESCRDTGQGEMLPFPLVNAFVELLQSTGNVAGLVYRVVKDGIRRNDPNRSGYHETNQD